MWYWENHKPITDGDKNVIFTPIHKFICQIVIVLIAPPFKQTLQ